MNTRKLFVILSIAAILTMVLSSCVPQATSTPESTKQIETPAVVPTTQPPAPSTATPFPLPVEDQVSAIVDGASELSSKGPGVSAPTDGIGALQEICDAMVNDDALVNPESCSMGFRQERTSTYSLQQDPNQTGIHFQMVSLNDSVNDFLDPEKDWQGKSLVVGGWLTPADAHVVLLNRENGEYTYGLVDANGSFSEQGEWQLRSLQELPTPPPDDQVIQEPYTFIAPEQACYSFTNYQACLNRLAPGFGGEANQAVIQSAVDELKAAGQLPQDFEQVDFTGSVASIMGAQAEMQCSNEYGNCKPSMVSAPSEWPFDEPLPTSGSITEVIPAVSVASVVTEITGFVTDANGDLATLPIGSYRVDLLNTSTGQWLSRFVGADSKEYYAIVRPLAVSGAATAGQGVAENPNHLVYSRIVVCACRKNGTGDSCTTRWGCCKKDGDCDCRRQCWGQK